MWSTEYHNVLNPHSYNYGDVKSVFNGVIYYSRIHFPYSPKKYQRDEGVIKMIHLAMLHINTDLVNEKIEF